MSWTVWDEDEWETVSTYIDGGRNVSGHPIGSASFGWRRRDPTEVKRIKAERIRQQEDEILARADRIRQSRYGHDKQISL